MCLWRVLFTRGKFSLPFTRFLFEDICSTTSIYGGLFAKSSEKKSVWIDEETTTNPRNIYGWSKLSAESLVQLYSSRFPQKTRFCVLRCPRFFPEEDDRSSLGAELMDGVQDEWLKILHTLNGRRVTLRDVARAHLQALEMKSRMEVLILANDILLKRDEDVVITDDVLLKRYVLLKQLVEIKGWKLPSFLDRALDASKAFERLNWAPFDTPENLIKKVLGGEEIEW